MRAKIAPLSTQKAWERMEQLSTLLIDAVADGASVGFLPPLERDEANAYWRGVIAAVEDGSRILLAAIEDGRVIGSVQLGLETRANGNHRAELMKLFVLRAYRRRGLARHLIAEAESAARNAGRSLLIMDTRKDGAADQMCQALGYTAYGEVPEYARSSNGELHTTVFYYRKLDE
jgi:ribosomal protein S18 acetylase RimI-like enzyme